MSSHEFEGASQVTPFRIMGGISRFRRLPLELRFIIYAELFKTCHPAYHISSCRKGWKVTDDWQKINPLLLSDPQIAFEIEHEIDKEIPNFRSFRFPMLTQSIPLPILPFIETITCHEAHVQTIRALNEMPRLNEVRICYHAVHTNILAARPSDQDILEKIFYSEPVPVLTGSNSGVNTVSIVRWRKSLTHSKLTVSCKLDQLRLQVANAKSKGRDIKLLMSGNFSTATDKWKVVIDLVEHTVISKVGKSGSMESIK
ncbi:hypothetical protein NA57DRAFT_61536 [Rhizodiscina lignyota]|uniref:Uncharacterized protein n=1 Tax=Rhizodiscina lignyota TaxID=1504668 RepID=A0A9P4M1D3_9PEZI|nr:hypothetical protein NA57DRAFT_61536 [Rhizodiscina lignyota]